MVSLHIPEYEELWFRKMFLSDEETMSYNHAWGGTIDFSEDKWADWYRDWVQNPEDERFYRYIKNSETQEFLGEISYHYNGKEYIADIIVYSKYRGRGYGKEGLHLLCEAAKSAGIEYLYDDIAIDNPSVALFLSVGFEEEYRTNDYIMLKKAVCKN